MPLHTEPKCLRYSKPQSAMVTSTRGVPSADAASSSSWPGELGGQGRAASGILTRQGRVELCQGILTRQGRGLACKRANTNAWHDQLCL